jgi:hypothetical protein
MWDHIPPDEVARKTRNYGLAGGWLTPPSPVVLTCPLCDGTGTL